MSSQNKPPLPSHVEETVQSIAHLHAEHYKRSTMPERIMERATGLLGQPGFLAVLTVAIAAWIGGNLLSLRLNYYALDVPPFPWLQNGLTLMALYMAALILTTQRRADQLADLREQMTLELSILTERKAAKLIELVEELRRDSPEVRDRVDHEAREMSAHADPHAMVGAIEKTNEDMKATEAKTPAK
ncbi:MAG TPA: DUF1003 domain-containing protein [Rhizomicrobium sp.]